MTIGEIVNLVVSAVTIIASILASTLKLSHDATKTLQQLSDKIDRLSDVANKHEQQLQQLTNTVNKQSSSVENISRCISNHDKRLHKIDKEEGVCNTSRI